MSHRFLPAKPVGGNRQVFPMALTAKVGGEFGSQCGVCSLNTYMDVHDTFLARIVQLV